MVNVELTVRPAAMVTPVETLSQALHLPAARRVTTDAVQVPWFWGALRAQVYSRMPTYRDRNELTVMLSPVVVTSPSDTVPGLGIAGDF